MTDDAAALRVQSDDIIYLSEVAPRWFADQQARRPSPSEIDRSWMQRHRKRRVAIPVSTDPGPIKLAAKPAEPRDVSADIEKSPPARVMKTFAALLPAECLAYQGFPHFLMACHLSKDECHATEEMTGEETSEVTGHHVEDAKTLSRTELRKLYPLTYKSWDNMKRRAQVPVHRQFEQFPDFLIEAGPRPGKSYTLDRIDPHDPEYAPGKVRWATKQEQANNRRITIKLTHDGETLAAADWERKTEQKAGTIRQRRNRHPEWTDEKVIYGEGGKAAFYAERAAGFAMRPWEFHQDDALREKAEEFFQRYKRDLLETPLEFCRRLYLQAIKDWKQLLDEHLDPYATDPFEGIAPHCVPEIKAGMAMLARLEPIGAWLERNLPSRLPPITVPVFQPRDQEEEEVD